MQCPKCKKEIKENSLKCDFCNTKVGSFCKKCNTYNIITSKNCINCNEPLLRICTECHSANLPNAKKCRKCGIEFINEEYQKDIKTPIHFANMQSQQKVKAQLYDGIKNAESRVITLSGESGVGKNLVLRYVISELRNAKLIWMLGTCSQNSQLSPFGYFQDVLLSFFNINNFCADTLQLKKNSIKFFKQDFPILTSAETHDLLNFLYPENTDVYENLYLNKSKMFTIIKKVITTIIEKTKVVFIVDHFEFIDGMSYDFIKELVNDSNILEKCKFVFITSEQKPGLGLVSSSELSESNYLDLSIAPFTPTQIETLLNQFMGLSLGKDFINFAIKLSGGNPAFVEQMALLQVDKQRCGVKNVNYNSLHTLIEQRLNLLKFEDLKAYKMLLAMSVLGCKFYPAILETIDNNSIAEFEQCVESLVNKGYITQLNNLTFEFKTLEIWKIIVSIVKTDEYFEEVLNNMYEIISAYKQSSLGLLAYIVQKLNNHDQAFEVWTLLMKHASYIGDVGLYIIAQKQALRLIENKNSDFYNKIKFNINSRVGKLLEPIDHTSAFDYLQNAIMMLGDDSVEESIELLGYLASCSMKSGNYWGVIECSENVLNKIPDAMSFEKVLVKTRLVKPLLCLGNCGQLINLVETEILPHLEKVLAKGRNLSIISIDELYETWLSVYFCLAEALIYQGDNRAFEVLKTIYEILEKNSDSDRTKVCRANILLALANTIKGDLALSTKILDDILKEFSIDNLDSAMVSKWNFVDILNKFYAKNYSTLYTELFNVAAYANNINDNFTKNILKTLLAKMFQDSSQNKKALEILEEQVAYFAKEKVATGVLLSWYLIAEIKLITSGSQFALDIATKALDIAQTPNINNYYFIAMFNKLIGEIYLAKQDFESSKVYFEKAIAIAKQFDLQYVLLKTYLQAAKLYQELALPKTGSRGLYIKQAIKMFQLAKNIPVVAEQVVFQKEIKKELNILTSFCKLNGIILKKES